MGEGNGAVLGGAPADGCVGETVVVAAPRGPDPDPVEV
jgi:hypothetical protein